MLKTKTTAVRYIMEAFHIKPKVFKIAYLMSPKLTMRNSVANP